MEEVRRKGPQESQGRNTSTKESKQGSRLDQHEASNIVVLRSIRTRTRYSTQA